MNAGPLRRKPALITVGVVALGLVAAWWAARGVEEWLIQRPPRPASPGFTLAVRVHVVSPPEYGVTAESLGGVVRGVIRARAPWVSLEISARNRVELDVELKPMEGTPDGYHGWVRASFHRSRLIPSWFGRPPDWSDRILVFGVPPRLGSFPGENVPGAVKIISEKFVAQALAPPQRE